MSLFVNTPLAASPALRWLVGSTHTYACETSSVLRVNQLGMENLIRSLVQVQVLDKAVAAGGYVVRVHIVHTEQRQQQGLHQLIAALNQVSEVLEVEVDSWGYARRICNRAELLAKWPGVRTALRRQFRQVPQTQALLTGLDQQFMTPGALELAILPNGVYGVLFAGLLGRSFPYQSPALLESRVLPRFFGSLDLPLQLRKQAEPPTGLGDSEVQLTGQGTLDEETFDAASWRRLLRQITDTPTLNATLAVTYHDTYALAVVGGTLQTATQHLRVQVPQVYHNELTHRLTLQQSPA